MVKIDPPLNEHVFSFRTDFLAEFFFGNQSLIEIKLMNLLTTTPLLHGCHTCLMVEVF